MYVCCRGNSYSKDFYFHYLVLRHLHLRSALSGLLIQLLFYNRLQYSMFSSGGNLKTGSYVRWSNGRMETCFWYQGADKNTWKIIGNLRNLVREKLLYLCNSPYIVSVNISRRIMRDRERAWESMIDTWRKGTTWESQQCTRNWDYSGAGGNRT